MKKIIVTVVFTAVFTALLTAGVMKQPSRISWYISHGQQVHISMIRR